MKKHCAQMSPKHIILSKLVNWRSMSGEYAGGMEIPLEDGAHLDSRLLVLETDLLPPFWR